MNGEEHMELADLIVKKLTNEASHEELERLNEFLKDTSNQALYTDFVKTWDSADRARGLTAEETIKEWNRLDQAIQSTKQNSTGFSIYKMAATVAALLFASLLAYWGLDNESMTITSADTIVEQQLEDGSKITLNSDATLKLDADYNEEKREVWLQGEAYFDVRSDRSKPFIIHAEHFDIKVVGTSFTVNTSAEQGHSEIIVTSGTVELSRDGQKVTLNKGDKGYASTSGNSLVKSMNEDLNFQAWRTRQIRFQDTPLNEVVDLINILYDQSLYIEQAALEPCPVTVFFDNESFESVLAILTSTLDLEVKQTDKGVLITGEGC